MGKTATLALKITGDAKDGVRTIDETEGRLDGFGKKIGGLGLAVGAGVGVAVGGLAILGKASFDAASDLEQSQGSISAVFGGIGESAVQMGNWSREAYKAVGLSQSAYDNVASVIGSQLKNAGIPMDQLAGKTNNLIKQGADMSAVFGGSAADAVDALSSVMKGEFDPIEKYGVSLNQTSINAELAARGQDKLTGQALKTAQTQVALDLVTKQTTATQGQFAAQSDSAAEKSQQLNAKLDNIKAMIGGYLLPIFAQLAGFFLDKVMPAFSGLISDSGGLGIAFAAIADWVTGKLVPAVVDLYNFLMPKLIPVWQIIGRVLVDDVWPAFKKIVEIVQDYVIPIFKNILGPALDGVRTFWGKLADAVDDNRDKFDKIYTNLKPFLDFLKNQLSPFIGGALKLAFEGLGKVIGPVIDTISWLLEKGSKVVGVIGKIGGLFGAGGSGAKASTRGTSLLGAAATGGRRLFGAAASTLGGGSGPAAAVGLATVQTGDTINITVNGALDPVAVADQIGRLLDARARRLGRAPAALGAPSWA
jgi:hypothetical protein